MSYNCQVPWVSPQRSIHFTSLQVLVNVNVFELSTHIPMGLGTGLRMCLISLWVWVQVYRCAVYISMGFGTCLRIGPISLWVWVQVCG